MGEEVVEREGGVDGKDVVELVKPWQWRRGQKVRSLAEWNQLWLSQDKA